MKNYQILFLILFLVSNLHSQDPVIVKDGETYINNTGSTMFVFTRSMVDSIGIRALQMKNLREEVNQLNTIISIYEDQIDLYSELDSIRSLKQIELNKIIGYYKELVNESRPKLYETRGFGILVGVGIAYTASLIVKNVK